MCPPVSLPLPPPLCNVQALQLYGDDQLLEPGGSQQIPSACNRAVWVLARLLPGLLKYAQAHAASLPELVSSRLEKPSAAGTAGPSSWLMRCCTCCLLLPAH